MNSKDCKQSQRMRDQLVRLMMSSLDFRHALSAATFLLEEDRIIHPIGNELRRRLKCYETSLVVSYGRPFSTARGRAAPFRWSLMPRDFKISVEELGLHDQMIRLRNTVSAHSDDEFTDISGEVWRSHLPDGKHFDFLAVLGGEDLLLDEATVERIHTFLWKVRHHIDKAIQSHPAPRDQIPVRIMDFFGDREQS